MNEFYFANQISNSRKENSNLHSKTLTTGFYVIVQLFGYFVVINI